MSLCLLRGVVTADDDDADHQRGDLGDVPDDRRHVGQEELAVAVEHAQAPRRQHEEADAREHDAGQLDREVVLLAVEPRGEHRGQRPGEQDADQADGAGERDQQPRDGARQAARLVVAALGPEAGVDRDERRRQHALTQQVLHQVGDAQGRLERVRRRARAEEGADDHLADETGAPGQEDAGGDQHRSAGAGRRLGRGRRGAPGGRAVRVVGRRARLVPRAGPTARRARRAAARCDGHGAWSGTAPAVPAPAADGAPPGRRRTAVRTPGEPCRRPASPPRRSRSPGARRSSTAPAAGWPGRVTRAPARTCRPGPASRRSARRAGTDPCPASSAARAHRRPGRSATALSLRPRNSRARRRFASP